MKTYIVCYKVIQNMERQTLCIPVSIFKDERLTPFELIVKYLKRRWNKCMWGEVSQGITMLFFNFPIMGGRFLHGLKSKERG